MESTKDTPTQNEWLNAQYSTLSVYFQSMFFWIGLWPMHNYPQTGLPNPQVTHENFSMETLMAPCDPAP